MPLIIYDPSSAADATRGSVCDQLVEALDLIPTFLAALGADPAEQSHRLEGRSLLPMLRGETPAWRRFVISDKRWKYVHAIGFRPMLYDLASDPHEFCDLGADPAYADERSRLAAALHLWSLRLSQRTTRSEAAMRAARDASLRRGILIGVWDEADLEDELWCAYRG